MLEQFTVFPNSPDCQDYGSVVNRGGVGTIQGLFRRMRRGLAASTRAGDLVHEFGSLMERSRSPVELRRELVRLSYRLSGARQVLLFLEHAAGARLTRVACWPEPSLLQIRVPVSPDDPTRTIITTPEGIQLSRVEAPLPEESVVRLPIRWRGETLGYLSLHGVSDLARGRRLQHLEVLCSMAAAAERAWDEDDSSTAEPTVQDPLTGLHHTRFLDAFLTHSLAIAGRRHEGLSLLVLAPDRLDEVRDQMGEAIADAVLQRVARAVVESLRVSDVVARTGRDTLTAALPAAWPADAVRVARQVVAVVAEAGLAAPARFPVTASVGVSGFPEHGLTPEALREAATTAHEAARRLGTGQVVVQPGSQAQSAVETEAARDRRRT